MPPTPETKDGESPNAAVPPTDGGAQLLCSPAQGPYTSPSTPGHLSGNDPQPPGSQGSKWAGIQDCNHPAKVKGSGYEVGLFVLDWLQESRCSAAASRIIGLITELYTYFLLLVKKTRNQPFPRDH